MTNRKVTIVTDSTAYLPKEICEQYHIHVVPNVVNWGTKTYRDGVDIGATEFFERLKVDPVHPTTSVASPGEFREVYEKAAAAGETVLGIHLSSLLSGTYATAMQVTSLITKPVEVLDTQAAAMALGFIVLDAARAAQAGKSMAEVKQAAQNAMPKVGMLFTVETLEYLRRGGRIGGAAAFVGGLLDMKPILELRNGRVEPVERVRTKKKAMDRILDLMADRMQGRQPVRLATLHAATPAEAKALAEAAQKRFGATEVIYSEISPTVATHTGPGTVGLAYCAG